MTSKLIEFLHALSRFRSAYSNDTVFEWQSRHFYEVSSILANHLSPIAESPQIKLYILDNKVIHATVLVDKVDIDLFGTNATSRFFDSFYGNVALITHATSSPFDIDKVLLDFDFFLDNWTLPLPINRLIDDGITAAMQDLLANSQKT